LEIRNLLRRLRKLKRRRTYPETPMADSPIICAYVARHGRTSLNAGHKFRGSANPPLDSVGRQQAHKLASLFKNIDLSVIFTSDKQRATETAKIIAGEKDTPIHISSNLRALNVGKFSGQPRNQENVDELESYLSDPEVRIPDGESLNEFRGRVDPCFQEAVELFMEEGVPPLIVAHSSLVHELGNVYHSGNHKAVLVEPGGCAAIVLHNGKLTSEPIFKPLPASAGGSASTIT